MFPVLYHSENIIIDSYSIFFLLAWIIGGIVFYREFRRLDWELEQMLFVMAGCVFGAVIGSWLPWAVTNWFGDDSMSVSVPSLSDDCTVKVCSPTLVLARNPAFLPPAPYTTVII